MKLLIDTHIFLWINGESSKLSEQFKELSRSGEHDFYLSVASAWEIQIKYQLGKLTLPLPHKKQNSFSLIFKPPTRLG